MKPTLRFKGFDGEWEKKAFNQIITRTSTSCNDNSIPSVEYEDINSKEGTLNKDIFKKDIHKLGKRFNSGDILFGKLRPYLENNLLANFEGVAVGDFWIFKKGLASTDYVFPFLASDIFQNICNMSVGSKMPRADWSLVGESRFHIPPTPVEQAAIGSYFKELDSMIAASTARLSRLEQVKRGSLQAMFPLPGQTAPALRFKGFTGEWKSCELGSIAVKSNLKNTELKFTETFTCSAEFGIINQREYFDNDISNSNNIHGYYVVEPNAFVYNPRISTIAPYGPILRNKTGRTGVISPLYLIFKFTQQVDYEFLDCYFKSSMWHSYMKQNGDSGARHDRFTIALETFFKMPIQLPTKAEQEAIGAYFKELDRQLQLEGAKLGKLRQLKQASLCQLFV